MALDAIRFLGYINSACMYNDPTDAEVGDVCFADDVQKLFIYTGAGWAQLGVAPSQADNISVSPLRLTATDDAETPKCDCDSHYLKLNTNRGEKMFCKCYVCGREWSKWAVSPLASIHPAKIPTKIICW